MAALVAASLVLVGCGGHRSPDSIPLTVVRFQKLVAGAYVPVTIQGHRYAFRVDSGSGKTSVDVTVADALHLPTAAPPGTVHGVGCSESVQHRRVTSWSVGDHPLPPQAIDAESTGSAGQKIGGLPFGGLLGSDVLSSFGSVELDFAGKSLVLGARPPAGSTGVPMSVVHVNGDVIPRVTLTVGSSAAPTTVVADTGSSLSFLGTAAASALGVDPKGNAISVKAVGCSVAAHLAMVTDPQLGEVPLDISQVLVGPFAAAQAVPQAGGGLIGLDALGAEGRVWLDFAQQQLTLGGND